MSVLAPVLAFLGLGGAPHEIAQGRRRVVTYLSFVCFVLLAASLGEEEWVAGKSTLTRYIQGGRRNLAFCGDVDEEEDAVVRGRRLQNTTDVTDQHFQIGLSIATQSFSRSYRTSEVYTTSCSWPLPAFVEDWNTGLPGDKTIKMEIFDITEGLLIFAMILQVFAWLGMVAVQSDAPNIGSSPTTVLVIRVLQGGALFFQFVVVVYFASSPAMKDFCNGFDGTWAQTRECGFGDGFEIACAALVLLAANEALACLWMSGANLDERNGPQGSSGSGGAAVFKGGYGYTPVGVPESSAPVAPLAESGSYQS